jgi:hypothetical protein
MDSSGRRLKHTSGGPFHAYGKRRRINPVLGAYPRLRRTKGFNCWERRERVRPGEKGSRLLVLQYPGCRRYNRQLFIDTLNDWGWFGEKGAEPPWYTGKPWS